MDTNSKKVLEALPDFQDFMALSDKVKELYVNRMRLENEIKRLEAATFREVMSNPDFFVNGKPIPVSHFENMYKHGGFDGELLQLRNSLADTMGELERSRTQFEIYQRMLEMHKTLVYQEKVMT